MKSLLDPSFRYVPSATTDIRETFARVRRESANATAQVRAEARADRAAALAHGGGHGRAQSGPIAPARTPLVLVVTPR